MLAPLIIGLAVLGVGAAVAITSSLGGGSLGGTGSGPGAGGVTPSGERLQWGISERSVVPVRIDGDGVEDFVGEYRVLELGSKTRTPVFVGGFRGSDFTRVWKAGPYGDLSEAAGATKMAVSGNRVIVTDYRSVLHILDVATGKELRALTMTDKAQRVCVGPEPERAVWIEPADHKSFFLNVETGQARLGPAPSWCPEWHTDGCQAARAVCKAADTFNGDPLRKSDAPPIPVVPEMRSEVVLSEGTLSVAVGYKSPGTSIPMAFGFDAGSTAPKWTLVIPRDPTTVSHSTWHGGDLAAGRFVTAYELAGRKGWKLVSVDARTGARQWETDIPRSESGSGPSGLTLSATRVYVPHWTWLDVFDASTGKYIQTVGVW